VPGGRIYFIIKPVKAKPSRSKKATKSIIKLRFVRFIIRPLQKTIRNNAPAKNTDVSE
jgi:hypothetical protein